MRLAHLYQSHFSFSRKYSAITYLLLSTLPAIFEEIDFSSTFIQVSIIAFNVLL